MNSDDRTEWDWDPFDPPVLDGRYACPECLEDIEVDAEGRPVAAVPSNAGAMWFHRECRLLHVAGHRVGLCSCFGPRPPGETRRQTARLCLERWRAIVQEEP